MDCDGGDGDTGAVISLASGNIKITTIPYYTIRTVTASNCVFLIFNYFVDDNLVLNVFLSQFNSKSTFRLRFFIFDRSTAIFI